MALTVTVSASIVGQLTKSLSTGTSADLPIAETKQLAFTDGSGAAMANKILTKRYTILTAANEDIDLAGSLTNDFGDAVVFTAIKAIMIEHVSGSNPAVVGNAGTPFLGPMGAAAHTIAVPIGGFLCIGRADATGWPVTAATADLLRIANAAGTSLVVDVTIVGI
jgi:hypothetical protein